MESDIIKIHRDFLTPTEIKTFVKENHNEIHDDIFYNENIKNMDSLNKNIRIHYDNLHKVLIIKKYKI